MDIQDKYVKFNGRICLILNKFDNEYIILYEKNKIDVFYSEEMEKFGLVNKKQQGKFLNIHYTVDEICHNDKGKPSIIYTHIENGNHYTYCHNKGVLHNPYGPAYIYKNGRYENMIEYHLCDEQITKEEWEKERKKYL